MSLDAGDLEVSASKQLDTLGREPDGADVRRAYDDVTRGAFAEPWATAKPVCLSSLAIRLWKVCDQDSYRAVRVELVALQEAERP